MADAPDVVLEDILYHIVKLVETTVTVVRVDVVQKLVIQLVELMFHLVYQEHQAEKVEMVESVEVMVSPELMEQQEHQELRVDAHLLVVMDKKEKLVVMEETGEHQVVIHQTQEQVDPMEEQLQDPIIA